MPERGEGVQRIVDAHVHVWDPRALDISWVRGTSLDGPRLPEDVDGAAGAVSQWIFVEADVDAPPAAEVEWVESLGWPGLAGVVADIGLDGEQVGEDVARLAARPLVRGVRHLLQDLPPDRLADAALVRGLGLVAEAGLVFDACVRWPQLEALSGLLAKTPDARVVLDHLGKPPVEAGLGSPAGRRWHDGVRRLADLGTVSVKLSGLRAEAGTMEAFRANGPGFLEAVLAAFGEERAMFASDWPVSTGADAGFATAEWIGMVRSAAGARWARVAAGTAQEVYGLTG